MLNTLKDEKEKKALQKEAEKNLLLRYEELSKMLSNPDLNDDEKKALLNDMDQIKNLLPEKKIKPFDLSGVVAAGVSGFIMLVVGLVRYGLDNKGLFSKDGNAYLDLHNFKK